MPDLALLLILALRRAVGDLRAPELRRVIALGAGLALATFVALWVGAGVLLASLSLFHWRWLNWLTDLLGAAAVIALTWLLFPAVATMVMGLFLDRVAAHIESRDYPGKKPPRRASVSETAQAILRLTGLTILLNILALPAYALAPGVNFFVFVGLNGYLLGREYFEVIALRRLDPIEARAMRRRFTGTLLVGGMAIAGLFAVPVVNFVAPVLATAFMLHLFEGLRHSELPSWAR